MLNIESCHERQCRLLHEMEATGLDLILLGNPKTIYYLTGALVDANLPQAFAMDASGNSLLVTNAAPSQSAATRTEIYTSYTLQRLFSKTTMQAEAYGFLRPFAARSTGAVGLEFESLSAGFGSLAAERQQVNITPVLDELRRVKDPDEIDAIRAAIRLTEAGYAAIKARLEPGMTEYEAFVIVHDAIVRAAQTAVLLRGDFACGVRAIAEGGVPTARRVAPGDTYIFDLFPSHEGYLCDLCRTFVAGRPSALQMDAWAHIMKAHRIAQRVIRPGVAAREVYAAIRNHLESFAPTKGSFTHHAGHGLGMDGWEYPWLTPGSEQVIQQGEVIACEPGLYGEGLQGGIRLEHNYLVGADGVTALDAFPMDLV
jgi:Xaa-Pro aminopeptidase